MRILDIFKKKTKPERKIRSVDFDSTNKILDEIIRILSENKAHSRKIKIKKIINGF